MKSSVLSFPSGHAVTAFAAIATAATAAALLPPPASAAPSPPGNTVRFATFNASLNRNVDGQLITDLSTPGNAQAATVAEIIQRVRPDVLLINELDFDAAGTALRLFQDNYLSVTDGLRYQKERAGLACEYILDLLATNTTISTALRHDWNTGFADVTTYRIAASQRFPGFGTRLGEPSP